MFGMPGKAGFIDFKLKESFPTMQNYNKNLIHQIIFYVSNISAVNICQFLEKPQLQKIFSPFLSLRLINFKSLLNFMIVGDCGGWMVF